MRIDIYAEGRLLTSTQREWLAWRCRTKLQRFGGHVASCTLRLTLSGRRGGPELPCVSAVAELKSGPLIRVSGDGASYRDALEACLERLRTCLLSAPEVGARRPTRGTPPLAGLEL